MAVAPFAISLQRYEAIDFCGLLGGDGTSFLVRYPSTTMSDFGLIQSFSYQVTFYPIRKLKQLKEDLNISNYYFTKAWLGIIGSLVALFGTSFLVVRMREKIKGQMRSKLRKVSDLAMYALAHITSQGIANIIA